MKTIAYLLYGNRREYHLELAYSILSAVYFLRKQPADIRIVLITDERTQRTDLPIERLVYTTSDFARWTQNGTYKHEAKLHALLLAMDRFQGSIVLLDTDTYFRAHPINLFERIGPGRALMHAVDDDDIIAKVSYWRPILEAISGPVAGYCINGQSRMLNSGVVGVHYSMRKTLNDVQALIRELYAIHPVFNIEQFAFTTILNKHFELSICPDVVRHYWGYERRFVHAQVGAMFPAFTSEFFESNAGRLLPVGFPAKSKIDQLWARVKGLYRCQGGNYRFAYLAYRSALSASDKLLANAWAHVALDVLTTNSFASPSIEKDFWQMQPERLGSHSWLAPETKQRWEEYWRLRTRITDD
jgi:hypothetical protein